MLTEVQFDMTEGSTKEKKPAGKESKSKNSHKHRSEPRGPSDEIKEVKKDRKYFLKYPQAVWHIQADELPELDSKELEKDEKRILALKTEAKQLYDSLSQEYEQSTTSPIKFATFVAQNWRSSLRIGIIRETLSGCHSQVACHSVQY